MKICSFEGCGRKMNARGLCQTHYGQKIRSGEIIPRTPHSKLTDEERVMMYVEKAAAGCWLWTSCKTNNGYGRASVRGSKPLAHRFSYETFIGPVPDGMTVHHKCSVTSCVNPEHLELATSMENNIEMFARKGYEARIAELEAEVAALKAKYE